MSYLYLFELFLVLVTINKTTKNTEIINNVWIHAFTGVELLGCMLSIAEGNGNPLQYSCMENPMDGGAW